MKKIKQIHKLLSVLLIGILCMQLSACGKKEVKEEVTGDVWVPEYLNLPLGETSISDALLAGNTLYYVGYNYDEKTETGKNELGKMTLGQNAQPEKIPFEMQDNDWIATMGIDKDGNLILVCQSTQVEGEDWEHAVRTWVIHTIDETGSVIKSMDVTETIEKNKTPNEEDSSYISDMAVDKDGNLYLSNSQNTIWVLNPEGQFMFKVSVNDWIQGIGTTKEGQVVACTYEENGVVIKSIDVAARDWGKKVEVKGASNVRMIAPGQNKGCLMITGESLKEYDMDGSEEPKEILNWLNADINSDNIRSFQMLEDGRIAVFSQSWNEGTTNQELILLTKKAASETVEKEKVVIGAMYIDQDTKSAVIDFNKKSDKYKVSVKEYGGDEDWEAALTQMNTDIMNGAVDIFKISDGSGLTSYIGKGALEDLTPYLDADSELKKEDFVQSALNVYTVDHKLYGIPSKFSLSTVFGKASELAGKEGWTLDEFMQYADSLPADAELLEYGSKASAFTFCMGYNMNQFIDAATGKCNFNSEPFIQVMEYANRFPETTEYDESAPSMPVRVQEGNLKLVYGSIDNMEAYQMYSHIFDGDMTTVGYPSVNGSGIALSSYDTYGICSKSAHKEAAWEFLRTFYLGASQKENLHWGFPVNKNALEEMLAKSMEKEWVLDENGEPELDEEGNPIEREKTTWGYDNWETTIYAATQEEVDAVRKMIDSADMVYSYDMEISKILEEELAPFYKGQKSAKEVAEIIQNRVQLYLDEIG